MTPSMFLSRIDLIPSSMSPWIAASSFFLFASTAIVSSWEDACYEPQVLVVICPRIQWMDGVETTRRFSREHFALLVKRRRSAGKCDTQHNLATVAINQNFAGFIQ